MRFQSTQASCGPAALRNALLARGVERSEEELAKLSGYKAPQGTSPKGMMRALIAVARDLPHILPAPIAEKDEDVAILRLRAAHDSGHVAILIVDNDEHWVVSFGTLGRSIFHISDSADSEMVQHLTPDKLIARWRGPGRKPFYAILV